jgi:preprotein translocase subunit SecA
MNEIMAGDATPVQLAAFAVLLRAKGETPPELGALVATMLERIKKAYALKESVEIPEALGSLERNVVINAIDHHWQEHLTEMEELRRSIGLRSYGQKDPLVEYKSEAYKYFEDLMNNVRLQICTGLFRSTSNLESFENMLALLSRTAQAVGPTDLPAPNAGGATPPSPSITTTVTSNGSPQAQSDQEIVLPKVTIRRETPKVGRNDPCPCGSGKKFKNCHGA